MTFRCKIEYLSMFDFESSAPAAALGTILTV